MAACSNNLGSSPDRDRAVTIRWAGIQQTLDDACSDTLIIMDAPFYHSSTIMRQRGVLELLAASSSEEQMRMLGRNTFTRAIIDLLQGRSGQRLSTSFSTAELYAKLLSHYSKIIRDRSPDRDHLSGFPSPLHLQISSRPILPSILLAPIRRPLPYGPGHDPEHHSDVNITIRLADESVINMDAWVEWIRSAPDGIKDVRIENGSRNHTFRGT